MAHAARALGLGVMLGCMVESGLGIAAGAQIASLCDHVDLDGNLLLADDPWPGRRIRRRRPASRPTSPASASRDAATSILAEGHSADPHYGKTARGVMRYRPEQVVAILDSERAGETQDGFPIVGDGRGGARLRADDRARRRRHRGRPLPAGLARAAEELHRGRARRRERPARVHLRRPGARRARRRARRRAARPAQAARRAQRPDRREPDATARRVVLTVGSDCAIGKMTRLARARRGGARARHRESSSSRPARPGSRSRAGGSRSTRSSPTSSPARPSGSCSRASSAAASCSGSRARARCSTRRTRASRSA